MASKAFYSFKMKLDKFNDDVELLDVLRNAINGGALTPRDGDFVLDGIDPVVHSHLARRSNSNGSRSLIVNHLRNSIAAAYVKDIYEEVTHYFGVVLEQSCNNGFDADRLVGEHSFKIDARALLKLGNWEAVCKEVSTSVLKSLESERSTLQLISKIKGKLGLEIDQALIETALPYLEVRHLLVHSDGVASAAFQKKYPSIALKGNKVDLNFNFILNFRISILKLLESFDASVVSKGLLQPRQMQVIKAT